MRYEQDRCHFFEICNGHLSRELTSTASQKKYHDTQGVAFVWKMNCPQHKWLFTNTLKVFVNPHSYLDSLAFWNSRF